MYLFLAALGLHCCSRAFSCCSSQRLLSNYSAQGFSWWLLLLQSTCSRAHGLQQSCHKSSIVASCGLRNTGSVVVVLGFSCPVACEIFPDQGSRALQGRFSTTGQPGKPSAVLIFSIYDGFIRTYHKSRKSLTPPLHPVQIIHK